MISVGGFEVIQHQYSLFIVLQYCDGDFICEDYLAEQNVYHELLYSTEFIFSNNPKFNGTLPEAFG